MQLRSWITGVVAIAVPLIAQAGVTVSFVHPERFNDIGDYGHDTRENMRVLEQMLTEFAKRYLPPDDDLRIDITNVDLAGTVRFTHRGANPDVRVLNGGADWPRIWVRYTWRTNGRTVGPVDELIDDKNYLAFGPATNLHEPLPYERRMLEKWFKARFVEHQQPRAKR
jgi:Protein of unknown function (DUF3016)